MYWACIRKYNFFSNVWIAITRKWSFAMNIGDKVEYYNEYKDKLVGVIENIDSDMDSYEEVKLKNGVPLYYSKKMKKYVPVKKKNIDTIFLTVKNTLGKVDYIMLNDAL